MEQKSNVELICDYLLYKSQNVDAEKKISRQIIFNLASCGVNCTCIENLIERLKQKNGDKKAIAVLQYCKKQSAGPYSGLEYHFLLDYEKITNQEEMACWAKKCLKFIYHHLEPSEKMELVSKFGNHSVFHQFLEGVGALKAHAPVMSVYLT